MNASELRRELSELKDSMFGTQYIGSEIIHNFRRASKTLEDECTIYFKTKLNVIQRKYLVTQLNSVNTSLMLLPILMHYFLKSQQKLNDFWSSFQISKKYARPLQDQYLMLLGKSYSVEVDEKERLDKLVYPPIYPI